MFQVLFDFHVLNWFSFLLAFVPAILNLGIVAYIVFLMPRNAVSAMFALFSFSLALWQLDDSICRVTNNALTLHYWDNILSYGWLLFGPLGLHFSLLYTGKRNYSNSFVVIALIYLPAIFFCGTYQAGLYSHHSITTDFWCHVFPHNANQLDIIQIMWVSLMVFITCGILATYAWQQRHNPLRKHQSAIIAVGLIIPTLQGFITQVIFPIVLHHEPVPITSTFLSLFSIATLISLNKYRLFNISEIAKIENILENMKDVVFTISVKRTLSYINPVGAKMIGLKKNDIESYSLNNLFPEESLDSVEFKNKVVTPSLQGKSVENIYLKMISSTGKSFPVMISANPIFSNNQQHGVLIVARDISDIENMQATLKASEKKFRTLIEKSSDAIGMVNQDGTILYMSQLISQILGYRLDELAEKKLFRFIPMRQKPNLARLCNRLLQVPGKSMSTEMQLKHKDGSIVWIEAVATNLLHESAVKAIVMNIRNITERRMAEDAIQMQNVELEKINTELDQFVYSASHDLRLPLTNILGLIDVTDLEIEKQEHKKYLNMMRKSAHQLDDTIKEILDYSHNNRTEVTHEKINLDEIINSVFENLSFIEGSEKIKKIVNVNLVMPFYTDKVRLKFILNNLITNAIKYHNHKQEMPFISVRAHVTAQKAVIVVQDNGTGISERALESIFNMFYRASTKTTGAGLGLYIAKEAVSRLSGIISVESKENLGSTFTVEIPNYSGN